MPTDVQQHHRLAFGLGVAALLLAADAVGTAAGVGWSLHQAIDAYVVSNLLIGLSFALCGAVIAANRPRHPVGWLWLGGGLLQLLTAAAAPTAQLLHNEHASDVAARTAVTVASWCWPWHIGLAIPLSLLLLPDGRLPSPRWRPVAWAVALTAPLFVVEIGTAPDAWPQLPNGYLVLRSHDSASALWVVSEARWLLSVVVGVTALFVRYRRGDELLRRQILWLVAAAALVLVAVTPFALVSGTPVAVLFTIPLIPAATTVGILRHQLLDIRLVIARGLAYAVLSAIVLGIYAALVVVLSGVASALIAALAVLPLRVVLQRAVGRLFYGERADPLRVASRVGERLGVGLAGTVDEIRDALRLPYVAVVVDDETVAESGRTGGATATMALGASGVLVVGLRSGERRLAPADERVLRLVAGPLGTAVQATRLSQDLQASRERLVTAREEERRRLRRDLHDGLGPLLTGVAMSADAAANLVRRAPEDAAGLLGRVRTDTRTAITEIRRIIDDLRPPALDELGLVAALEARAAQTVSRQDGAPLRAVVDAPSALPQLPAAIEVAAYRIATEAMTNAVRHSDARALVVRLRCDDALHLEVRDDGSPSADWTAGVGITGMHDRVAELGGRCEVGPSDHGGQVRVSLPLVFA